MAKKKYYAVAVGRKPGIYSRWFGPGGAHAQVEAYKGARFKGFATLQEAQTFLRERQDGYGEGAGLKSKTDQRLLPDRADALTAAERVPVYTDGSSLGNPGPGGYGVVIPFPDEELALSGGFRLTTNNRMELLACIVGLEQFNTPTAILLFSDSRYVVDGITKGWAKQWKCNHWKTSTGAKALNIDLWQRLLDLCDFHDVAFVWVKGHAGNPGNEKCDRLASQAAALPGLPPDPGYEGRR